VFFEKKFGNFLIQSEYWTASHKAVRNAANTLEIVSNAGINDKQRENFLGNNASKADVDLTEADVVTNVNYTASTFYVRLAYEIQTPKGQIIPYVFYDWMSNNEVIQNKRYGGDNEAGFADDGKFSKPSIGVVYRPISQVAIKLDGSMHSQTFNGKRENYPEIRADISFAFNALKGLR